ncbi:minichromosome maintenance protein MCM, partial [Candidatus Woesearchaeota archaeon]|nr:minichromosome maintenance protein MCM [Candidatus Woesearchaeota archaeon]
SLIKFIENAAPRARYVVGRAATSAGITASVVKDEFIKGWALEAGAIVLASGGYLLLDEMDKMSEEDTSAMHEAMAQQTVTIHKANIHATLQAQTSVLAAANPKFGRFDPYQPIAAQIDLPPALINRFDLIFPVRDLPNKEKDSAIATHILELQHNPMSKEPPIEIDLMRKYIAHAKQSINPKLTPGAIEEIKNFYVNLRNSSTVGDSDAVKPIPISARQLESLVRLAEGSARIRLSSKVTRSDARKSISIMRYCLMQVGFDPETGQIDIDRMTSGITASTRNKIHTVREIIGFFESKGKKSIPMEDIMAEATDKKISESQVEEIIEKLKREGEIYEPRRGFISKI